LALVVAATLAACGGRRAPPEPAAVPGNASPLEPVASAVAPVATNEPPDPANQDAADAGAEDPPPAAAADDVGRTEPLPEREPQTESAREIVELLAGIERDLVETRYQHRTVVHERRGKYFWDCSGMVAWLLERAAPRARSVLPDDRPLARDFYDTIAESPADEPRRGWLRLTGPEQLAPGDLFAWRKPDFWAERPNTGHVGFVLSTPQPHPEHPDVWVMRIADATKMLHEDDSRPADGEGGFGTATMAFQFDADGTSVAYGWYGASQPPETFVPTTIAFGRVSR
jgi:hypothetical protein